MRVGIRFTPVNVAPIVVVQLISCCRLAILNGKPLSTLFDQSPLTVLIAMESCLKLNEQYQAQYKLTKEKLAATPKGRQFEFAEDMVRSFNV